MKASEAHAGTSTQTSSETSADDARLGAAVQEAVKHGPGRFSELYVFEPTRLECPARALIKAAQLLKSVELNLAGKPLQVLVALAPGYLKLIGKQHLVQQAGVWPESLSSWQILVQIAAESEDERTHARRLVRRLFRRQLHLKYQSAGGRHLANKDPFGYPELPPEMGSLPVCTAPDAAGGVWLMFQQCVQDVDAFYRLSPEQQDEVMGRPKVPTRREELAHRSLPPRSHVTVARNGEAAGKGPLLRRSFVYERYDEAGLNFLALAAEPGLLHQALTRFIERDALSQYVELRRGGLFFVPSSAAWLRPGIKAPVASRDAPEAPFYPSHPVVLYEVTPSAKAFFVELFHANEEQLDDPETGQLREDVLLLTRGLTKLICGSRLRPQTALCRLLSELFCADLSAQLFAEHGESATQLARTWEASRRELAECHAVHVQLVRLRRSECSDGPGSSPPAASDAGPSSVEETRTRLEQSREHARRFLSTNRLAERWLVKRQLDPGWAEAVIEMLIADAEVASGSGSVETQRRIEELYERATSEARALNESLKEYMTITP